MNIVTTTEPKVVAEFLVAEILKQLESGKKVFWFATGGSSVKVQTLAAEIIRKHPHSNLTVTLTDERYGPVGHKDSNWAQTLEQGFNLPEAKIIRILNGSDRTKTTEDFDAVLKEELPKADFKIGLFGIGADGHTSGMLPGSEVVNSPDFAFSYQAPKFERITITPKTVVQLDEAVVFMQGREKWPVIKDLKEREVDIHKQPAQILKKVQLLTIFSDYPSSRA